MGGFGANISRAVNCCVNTERDEEKVRLLVCEYIAAVDGEGKREEGFCCVVQTLSRSKQIRLYGRWLVTPIVGPRET